MAAPRVLRLAGRRAVACGSLMRHVCPRAATAAHGFPVGAFGETHHAGRTTRRRRIASVAACAGASPAASTSVEPVAGSQHFSGFAWGHGRLADCDPAFPTVLSAWSESDRSLPLRALADGDSGDPQSHFGFVQEGPATLKTAHGEFTLQSGMYFSHNGEGEVSGGRGIVMSRLNHNSFFHIGGPVEEHGRLLYIDGCTDSLLIPPVRMGDPCLNLLYFPEGIDQTSHTHPSDRIGVVYSGRGKCVTPDGDTDLTPGMIFRIHADGQHKFQTLQGSSMRVIAFHPDSDFGPQDQDHPMINRTIVDGTSAAQLEEIQTHV